MDTDQSHLDSISWHFPGPDTTNLGPAQESDVMARFDMKRHRQLSAKPPIYILASEIARTEQYERPVSVPAI